jgi:predicted nucleotidyltransferase
MQAKIRSKAKIISEMTDYVNSLDIIIFAYIFGSFGRGEAFSDIDIGTYLKSDLDRSFLEIEFEMEDKIGTLTGYPVDVRALNKAPASFVFQIIKDGILIKDINPDIRSDFEGLVFKKTHDFIRFRNEYLREISNAPI